MFPEAGITKGDVLCYYERESPIESCRTLSIDQSHSSGCLMV